MRRKHVVSSLILAGAVLSTLPLSGCAGTSKNDGKTEVTMVQYKPEAVAAFEEMEERFNATHDDIHLTIESPNEAMTVLKHGLSAGIIRTLSVSAATSTTPTFWTQICFWMFPILRACQASNRHIWTL